MFHPKSTQYGAILPNIYLSTEPFYPITHSCYGRAQLQQGMGCVLSRSTQNPPSMEPFYPISTSVRSHSTRTPPQYGVIHPISTHRRRRPITHSCNGRAQLQPGREGALEPITDPESSTCHTCHDTEPIIDPAPSTCNACHHTEPITDSCNGCAQLQPGTGCVWSCSTQDPPSTEPFHPISTSVQSHSTQIRRRPITHSCDGCAQLQPGTGGGIP